MRQSNAAKELKKRLAAAGFEVFRVVGPRIHLADRVRDNLIMDSGVSAMASPLAVRFVARAAQSSYVSEAEDALFERARGVAETAASRGYREVETTVARIEDPGGGGATLETWFEVTFEKQVASEDQLIDELRFALGLEKTAGAS